MKTKYFLSSMVLTALFAACTNDDFESVQNSAVNDAALAGRAKGELVLKATKAEVGERDAETRIVATPDGTGYNWLWEDKNDKIGAVVVNYKETESSTGNNDIATAADKYMLTNYPFAPDITEPSQGANFSTPTAVVEGAYLFYNRYDGDNTRRGQISHEIDRIQVVKAGAEAGLKQVGTAENGGQNFFVSPVVDMAIPDGSSIEVPVSVTSAHSILRFRINADVKAEDWGNFEVNKITLKALGTQKFMRKLTIDPKAITDIQLELRGTDPTKAEYHYFKDNGAIVTRNEDDGTLVDEEQVRTAMNMVTEAISKPKADGTLRSIGTVSEETDVLTYQLEEPYVFESKDDQLELMVIVPSGKYLNATGLPAYQNQTQGFFLLSVYTNEGVYHKYISSSTGAGSRTLARGSRYGMGVETICNLPGKTNLDQVYNPDKGFVIETTADWNYAMEYIDHNSDDFGKGSKWGVPLFTLVDDVTIDVDAEHYFKDYEVKYTGDATLNLIGQNEYKFNPNNTIFAAGSERPTLQVLNQPDATVVFDKDINSSLNGEDGKDVTEAIKLVSDAKVVVKEGTVVEFESLDNRGEMTIEKDVTTEDIWGNVSNADITAAVIKSGVSTAVNKGTITVAGQFQAKSTFTNAKGATIKVNGFLNEMNDENRGKATFTELVNNGVLDIEKGGTNKGTYGGAVKVTTKLTNTNEIIVNGELEAEEVASTGTITVAEDPYALIKLNSGSVTGSVGGVQTGSVVLAKADQYEMYMEYYNNWSELNVMGVIETTLNSQDEYIAVLRNFNKYYDAAEVKTALEVLNKITLTAPITLAGNVSKPYAETFKTINFYLKDNAQLNVTGLNNVAFKGIYSNGKNNAVMVNAGVVATSAEYVEIAAGADFTIGKGVNMTVKGAKNTTELLVNGTLTNNETLNNNKGAKEALVTVVGEKGVLNNQGIIGIAARPLYMFSQKQIKILNQLNDMVNEIPTSEDVAGYHITTSNPSNEVKDLTLRGTIVETWTKISHNISTPVSVDGTDYYIWKTKGQYYHFGGADDDLLIEDPKVNNYSDVYTVAWKAEKEGNYTIADFPRGEAIQSYIEIVDNFGVVNLDLKKIGTDNLAEAYGYIKNNHKTKNGDFTVDFGDALK